MDDRCKACRRGLQIQSFNLVDDIKESRLRVYHLGLWKRFGPFPPVHIPLHGNDGGQISEGLKHRLSADVAGMHDEVYPMKDSCCFRS
jgi:hypothetical protein